MHSKSITRVFLVIGRMQSISLDYNKKIEVVNRERKFHQVNHTQFLSTLLLSVDSSISIINQFEKLGNRAQQNTAVQINALTAQWRELCQKNIEIEAARANLKIYIDQLKLQAKDR